MTQVPQSYIEAVLFDIQSAILAYYKKEYVSGGNYPPLSYYVDVLRMKITKGSPPAILARYRVSPDALSRVKDRPTGLTALRGNFYLVGVGWIEPDASEENITLVLNPRPKIYIKHTYAMPPDARKDPLYSS